MKINIPVNEIKQLIAQDSSWAVNALLAIASKQTSYELNQNNGISVEKNGVGFNKADSDILTNFAWQYKTFGVLSPRQMQIVKQRMPKYARQYKKLMNAADK